MAEASEMGRTPVHSLVQKFNIKLFLKWTTFSLLLLSLLEVVWDLIEELHSIYEIEDDIIKNDKDAADEMREWKVSVWSTHVLYFAYILLAVYATVKEKYPLLLSFAVVDLTLDFIYVFDYESIFIFLYDMSVTLICFITAIYFKYIQNIPWNPF